MINKETIHIIKYIIICVEYIYIDILYEKTIVMDSIATIKLNNSK